MTRAPTIQQSMILLLEWTSYGMLEHDMPTSQHDTSALNWITDCCHTLMFSYTLKFVWASLNMLRSSKLRLAISSLSMLQQVRQNKSRRVAIGINIFVWSCLSVHETCPGKRGSKQSRDATRKLRYILSCCVIMGRHMKYSPHLS